MVQLVEMDERMPRFSQMDEQSGPVALINRFTVKPESLINC
jgi:hypothetical protein